MVRSGAREADFFSVSDALKRLRGEEFEAHAHPAVLVDRATDPGIRVWGWWTPGERPFPCMLWSGERGWSASAVEPDEMDAPGYELAHWSHRIKLLDLAIANAIGPYRTLSLLELNVAADTTLGLGPGGPVVRDALLWGIVQLRAARAAQRTAHARVSAKVADQALQGRHGTVDEELARYALVPTLAKPRTTSTQDEHKDPNVTALVQALTDVRLTGRLVEHE